MLLARHSHAGTPLTSFPASQMASSTLRVLKVSSNSSRLELVRAGTSIKVINWSSLPTPTFRYVHSSLSSDQCSQFDPHFLFREKTLSSVALETRLSWKNKPIVDPKYSIRVVLPLVYPSLSLVCPRRLFPSPSLLTWGFVPQRATILGGNFDRPSMLRRLACSLLPKNQSSKSPTR